MQNAELQEYGVQPLDGCASTVTVTAQSVIVGLASAVVVDCGHVDVDVAYAYDV